MAMADPYQLTVTGALQRMAAGTLTARELSEALIDRCSACEALNALVSRDWEGLRAAADRIDRDGLAGRGLGGIPLCFKDNIATGRFAAGAATGALAATPPGKPAPLTTALLDAGALVGATGNMHELAFGITSNNGVTGAVRNPWNPEMIPGGSSGGVAAAVAAGLMPAGIGTDTGASVRLPAALCGVVGFRPTVGRYPGAGIVPISATRDTAGPIARSVDDVILLDRTLAGGASATPPVPLRGLRLGVPRGYFYEPLDPAVARAAEASLQALRAAGVTLVEADMAELGALNEAVSFPVALYEFIRDLRHYLDDNGIDLTLRQVCEGVGSPDVRGLFESLLGEGAMPEAVYREAMTVHRPRLRALYRDYFAEQRVSAVIFPTAPMTARPIGQDETVTLNGVEVPTFGGFIRNTDPASNAGIPGISLPVAVSEDGLPIGMELDAAEGDDQLLLAIAAAVEPVFAFSSRPPGF